jgi:hypothetical protein
MESIGTDERIAATPIKSAAAASIVVEKYKNNALALISLSTPRGIGSGNDRH